jgi:hypothetical protein
MIDLSEALNIMRNHLISRKHHLNQIAEFRNGFEHWLKFELAVALREQTRAAVWQYEGNTPRDYGDVGVEYRYRRTLDLMQNTEEMLKEKLIDLWFGHSPTLYFELKTAFDHANKHKQIRSWLADFAKLDALLRDEDGVAGYASVLVSIGFDNDAWKSTVDQFELRERSDGKIWDGGLIVDDPARPIRLCALWKATTPLRTPAQ